MSLYHLQWLINVGDRDTIILRRKTEPCSEAFFEFIGNDPLFQLLVKSSSRTGEPERESFKKAPGAAEKQ